MPLYLNDEQTMLRDTARDFVAEQAPVSHMRKLRDRYYVDWINIRPYQDASKLYLRATVFKNFFPQAAPLDFTSVAH